MGDIKRKRKKFSAPKKLYDATRIETENKIIKKYGLKNKREVWKAKTEISRIRKLAKKLLSKSADEQNAFFGRLNKKGLNVKDISEALALTEEHLLDRRLQTFVFKKKLANSVKQARQLIVHKHILVDGSVVNIPSFNVSIDLENKISFEEFKPKEKENKNLEELKNDEIVEVEE